MKRLLCVLLFQAAAQPLWAAWGGPDSFGYLWNDCDEPGGPAYQWTEIRDIGNQLDLGDDESRAVALPGPFKFYGIWQDSVYVCSNGFLSFGSDYASAYPDTFPSPNPPNSLAAPLWNDLNPSDPSSGNVYFHHDLPSGRFIVEWDSVVHFGSQNYYSFQAVLDPADNSLSFLYRTAHPGWMADAASTGIEDHDGEAGLWVASNLIRDQYAVMFSCPPDSHDMRAVRIKFPAWHVEPGGWVVPELLVQNGGLAEESFPAVCLISSGGAPVYSDTAQVSGLAPGDSAAVPFQPWQAGQAGLRYSVTMFCDHKDDQDQRNDTLRLEAVAFDYSDKITSGWRQGTVSIDGVISPGEWPEEWRIDFSDILGKCGTVQPPGTAWIFAQNDSDFLYLALDAAADQVFEDGDVWTIHIDDDGSGTWSGDGSEGRYWLARYSVETLEFIPMPGGSPGPASGVLWASSSAGGNLQREMAIPLGTSFAWQLARNPGQWCRAQSSAEDGGSGTMLGWWPQDMAAEHDENPQWYGQLILAVPASGVATGPGPARPQRPSLIQNSPNPFNRGTTIKFQLHEPISVTLRVYNIAGQEVRTLVKGNFPAGEHQALWDGRNASGRRVTPGAYFLRLTAVGGEAGPLQATRRMVLVE